jgi:signal transduction histidine kinase
VTHTAIRTAGVAVRARRRWLRNQPIRVKLAVILLLPVLATLGLTAVNVVSAADRAGQAGRARELVAVGGEAARLAASLQTERAAAALVFAKGAGGAALDELHRAGSATDIAVAEFKALRDRVRVPAGTATLLARIDTELAGLDALRDKVAQAPDAVLSAVTFRYRATIADLLSYRQGLGQIGVDAATANGLRAAAALSAAIESTGQLEVAAVRAMAAGVLTPVAQQEVVAADTGITESMQTFADLSPPSWPGRLNGRVTGGDQVLLAERLQGLVVRSQPGLPLALGIDPKGWVAAVGARMDLMHRVESDLDADLLTSVTAERDAQMRGIWLASGVVAGLLLVALVIGAVVAGSLSGSLSRLQTGAIEVAERRLPAMVRELDAEHADPATVTRLLAAASRPIPVDGSDEVGRVADAFNHVTASAIRVAGEQAALRAGVGAILVSLSRRLQLRADAMMGSLDVLERNERDTDRLAKLFTLDHIAVLIRRLIFNLQVLAGGSGGGRVRADPVLLTDVLRAAGQEIDAYQRVVATAVDPSVHIRGESVDELVHLLAELLDNATRFSPPESPVRVEAKQVGDQLHIQIRDEGTGLSAADLNLIRARIANPHRLDHRTTQHMGLPVAGALAQRLGVTVWFRSVLHRGTWVNLTVPAELMDRGRSAGHETTAALHPVAAPGGRSSPSRSAIPRPRGELASPVIYDELRHEPTRSWFQPGASPGGGGAPVPAAWQASARAALAAGTATVSEWTRSGLPIRQPGDRVVPTVDLVIGQPAPARRDPDRIRLQMAAYQNGLGRAGRGRR